MARVRPTPPALLAAELVRGALDAGGLLVCTDFDGSLAPIVHRPEEARPLPRAAAAAAWLSRSGAREGLGAHCPVGLAVVTGRDSDDVARRLHLGPEGVASGSWTMGASEPSKSVHTSSPPASRAEWTRSAASRSGEVVPARPIFVRR